ncbi:hypothetical protein [Streptomyces sp. NPDC050704]|uniref:hypothetical protein n=1 Tax=Streptomyces sp. NPDC050704 TaxID=3157219 RepID=UPI0034331F4D
MPATQTAASRYNSPRTACCSRGDTIAAAPAAGTTAPGVFDLGLALDRQRTLRSFREPALLDTEMARFGHGDPVTRIRRPW